MITVGEPMLAASWKSYYNNSPERMGTVDDFVDLVTDTYGFYLAEPKLDGVRARLVHDRESGWRLINRRGADITYRYPDIIGDSHDLPDGGFEVILDGEILANSGKFSDTHKRDAQQSRSAAVRLAKTIPVGFHAFDCIQGDPSDSIYMHRREYLTMWAHDLNISVVQSFSKPAHLWELVKNAGLEGMIVKRFDSRYVPGRSKGWFKVKLTNTLTAVVTGYEAGNGTRQDTFGALSLAVIDDKEIVPIGKVGSGFNRSELREIATRLNNRELLTIEVEYQEVTEDRQLRFPVFKGVRDDLTLKDASVSQLGD